MPLECTMLCLDDSEFMRNGDYSPTRMMCQSDTSNVLVTNKTMSHPESTVGLLTMAGKGVTVHVSPTDDSGKLMAALHGLQTGGSINIVASIQVAMLALKHRTNKNGGQRIIVVVGSPVEGTEKQLKAVGRKLKKNNIALDIVSMGETEENATLLAALVESVNKNDNS